MRTPDSNSISFLAIDVETANADYSSICQIGIAKFKDGEVIERWSTLVNPESYFDSFNVSIHGITPSMVENSPTFDALYDELSSKLNDRIVVHHMPFDRTAINRVCEEYELDPIDTNWLDSAKIVRRTWEEFAYKGYGLKNVADHLNIEFKHHDALQDAIAAGLIVVEACKLKNLGVDDWLTRITKPISSIHTGGTGSTSIKQSGNTEGSLYGENIVFTGALSIPRIEAAGFAAKIGCNVLDSVTKKTTILVVGTQDSSKLAGYEKSSKHRKAEGLIEKGNLIKILTEKDFVEMCNSEGDDINLDLPTALSKSKPGVNNQDKQDKAPVSIEINLNEVFEKALNTFSEEEKSIILESYKERESFIDNFPVFSHKDKRVIGNIVQLKIEHLQEIYNEYDIDSIDDLDIDILFTIQSELDDISEMMYDLMKNKASVGDFYDSLDNAISSIELDLEEANIPNSVESYTKEVIKILNEGISSIDALKNERYS
jgi:DNA polymerase III subunit epsilon